MSEEKKKVSVDQELDSFVEELQQQILEETRQTYGDAAYKRWLNPVYKGALDSPDGCGCITGPCGDTMKIFLKFEDDHVKEASFETDGCGSSTICGSFAAEMAIGKTPDELPDVTQNAILEKLGGLPEEETHCALLAANTIQDALNDYMIKCR